MKIFITKPENTNEKQLATFLHGVDHLRKQGHNIVLDKDMYGPNYFKKAERTLKDTDIVIVEVTNADVKVGYEIARALNEKKIVIGMYDENKKSALAEYKSKSLLQFSYNKNNVSEVIDTAITKAKGKLDTKFILIISSEIDRYLEWASQEKRMHKAQIVRDAVESVINKDKDYKKYLTK